MPNRKKNEIIIFGSAETAELAKYYFDNDSIYSVVAFTVDDSYARILFDISSKLNTKMINMGNKKGYTLNDESKGFIFNGTSSDLINFLNIGSDPV